MAETVGKDFSIFISPVWLALFPAIGIVCFFLYPLAVTFFSGLQQSADFFSDPLILRYISLTLAQAFLSTLLSGFLGTWSAIALFEKPNFLKKIVDLLSLICFSLPQILVVLAFFSIFDFIPDYHRLLGWPAVLMAHVFLNFGLFYRNCGLALTSFDRTEEISAISLGASRWQTFCRITFPKLLPSLRGASVLCFLYCMMSFVVVLMLGGGPKFTTLEVALYQAVKVNFDLGLAVRLASIQLLLGVSCYFWEHLKAEPTIQAGQGIRWVSLYSISQLPIFIILGFLCLAPILSLFFSGISKLPQMQWTGLSTAILFSLGLALFVGSVSTLVGLTLSYTALRSRSKTVRAICNLLTGVPIAVSSILLSLGMMHSLSFLRELSPWIPIAVIQTLIAIPISVRPIRESLLSLPQSVLLSAQSLGANPWQILKRIELPTLFRALLLSFIFSAALSLGEVGAVLMFAQENTITLPLLLYRWMGAYRFSEAMGAAMILLCLYSSLFGFGEILSRRVRA